MIPIDLINRDKSIWGDDAAEFKLVLFLILFLISYPTCSFFFFFPRPERWENIPNGVSSVPGVWANLMTFLGGPRACIGYRFSLVE